MDNTDQLRAIIAELREHTGPLNVANSATILRWVHRLEALAYEVARLHSERDEAGTVVVFHDGTFHFSGPVPKEGTRFYTSPPSGTPAGFVMVPVEPTEAMIEASCKLKLARIKGLRNGKGVAHGVREDWEAMLLVSSEEARNKIFRDALDKGNNAAFTAAAPTQEPPQ